MKRIVLTGVLLLLGGQWLIQEWQDWRNAHYFAGYVETDLRYFAAPQSASLIKLHVKRGASVHAGDVLFSIDPTATQKQLADLRAQQKLALLELNRNKMLLGQKAIAQSVFDASLAHYNELTASAEGLEYTITQLSPKAPEDAVVEYTYFNEGEWVVANQPVVSLLIPTDLKVRFFVPETKLSRLQVGTRVSLDCDGCVDQTATISYISPYVEYTPPTIYSRDERHKLLFMCEAYLDQNKKLPVGLPVLIKAPK